MAEETNGSNSPSRIDRIERVVEVIANVSADLQQDVKILPRVQVVLSDRMKELACAQKQTEQNMNALILTVDEIIRGRKQP